jgi:protein SCO1/2
VRKSIVFNSIGRFVAVVAVVALLHVAPAAAIEKPGEVLKNDVGVFTELGAKVDLSQEFTSVSGERKPLKDFVVPGKPILVAPVYYKCPRLCGLLLDGLYTLLNELDATLSKDFSVLVIGFDPTETPADAAKVMAKFNSRLVGEAAVGKAAIHYVVGGEAQVATIMRELGFKFIRDGQDFAHSAALMILTPTGEISQYFTGITFPSWDVRLSLVEASKGGIGTAVDHLLLYCFRFDPLQGKYTWAVVGLLRIGGALTLVGLGLVYFLYARKGRGAAKGACKNTCESVTG